MKQLIKILILLLLVSCSNKTPSDKIIEYAREKYGENFKEGIVDLSKVFEFKWQTLYIFSPLTYPEDVTQKIGFEYKGEIVPDDVYLFLFVENRKVVRKYLYANTSIGFDDNDNTGVYKIENDNGKYLMKFLNKDNYWLYKLK